MLNSPRDSDADYSSITSVNKAVKINENSFSNGQDRNRFLKRELTLLSDCVSDLKSIALPYILQTNTKLYIYISKNILRKQILFECNVLKRP